MCGRAWPKRLSEAATPLKGLKTIESRLTAEVNHAIAKDS